MLLAWMIDRHSLTGSSVWKGGFSKKIVARKRPNCRQYWSKPPYEISLTNALLSSTDFLTINAEVLAFYHSVVILNFAWCKRAWGGYPLLPQDKNHKQWRSTYLNISAATKLVREYARAGIFIHFTGSHSPERSRVQHIAVGDRVKVFFNHKVNFWIQLMLISRHFHLMT